ncbi:hypothetical protein P3X46_019716 [Hevea brasiliensis]|uniref:DUF7880 domain-containing protein n=1 Tax=Hevea brasiliensis TaxID=3981 RepID=A0ABQ9LJN5_HEVBR|nr:uncharacterized protein LOC110662239 [Hevea brasiliensis]KAJ9168157.1 hypothetical protein P3X46_019716 [Hevea brasiliensis]
MAITYSTARVSSSPLNYSAFPCLNRPLFAKPRKKLVGLKCALSTPKWKSSRRLVSISLLFSRLFLVPNHATAGSFLDKYVKKKKLDPLEAYVPAVILTQFQIKDLEKTLEVDQPQFANCRYLLRSGPAASLRINIRAVAQYASDAGSGNTAFNDVDQCLRALEELDSLLLLASRNDPAASVKSMKAKIGVALDALDSLLHTVPPDVFDKGKAIADAYRSSEEPEPEPESLEPELKKLESLL